MKTILIFVTMPFVFKGAVNAQTPPANEFELHLSATSILLARGDTDSVNISVLRPKTYKTGDAVFSFTSPERKGIELSITPIPDQPNNYLLRVSANEQADPGEYNIIPSCTIRNKSKGIVLKVKVN